MNNKILKTSALVLKSIDWSESSKIVSLYTRDLGRMEVIAKGARRKNSIYQGVLETLNCIEVIIYFSSSRELQHLGSVSMEDSYGSIRKDLSKTAYALAILELINALIHPREGDPVFYDFICAMMGEISKHVHPIIIFWYFILKIASYLGFKPLFDVCFDCGKEIDTPIAYFHFQNGSLYCPSCADKTNSVYAIPETFYHFLLQLQSIHHKKTDTISSYPNPASKLTDFLLRYLSFHTGQPLHLNALQLIVTN